MVRCTSADNRGEAAHCHAKDGIALVYVSDAVAHIPCNRGALQANWTNRSCWVQVEHVEDVAEVEPCCLYIELDLRGYEWFQTANVLTSDHNVGDGSRASKMHFKGVVRGRQR